MLESILTVLADRVILGPTRDVIPSPHKSSVRIAHGRGHLDVWAESTQVAESAAPGPFVLKFPGTESRAEDAESLALGCWDHVSVWSVNPPGYGESSGTASLINIPAMATAAAAAIRKAAGPRPVIAEGFSLGCVAALYLAAVGRVDGLLLRNPPPLREVVRHRAGRWSLGLVPALISAGIPEAIDSVRNAAACKVPALFVTALRDRIVPGDCQRLIMEAYRGTYRVLEQPEGDHGTPLSESEVARLKQLAAWLLSCVERQGDALPAT